MRPDEDFELLNRIIEELKDRSYKKNTLEENI
jgi:hypothetical protein